MMTERSTGRWYVVLVDGEIVLAVMPKDSLEEANRYARTFRDSYVEWRETLP